MSEESKFSPEDLTWSAHPDKELEDFTASFDASRKKISEAVSAAEQQREQNESPVQPEAETNERPRPISRILNGVREFFKKHATEATNRLSGLFNEIKAKVGEAVSPMNEQKVDALLATDFTQLDEKTAKSKLAAVEKYRAALEKKKTQNKNDYTSLMRKSASGLETQKEINAYYAQVKKLNEEKESLAILIDKVDSLAERLRARAGYLAGQAQAEAPAAEPASTPTSAEKADKKPGFFAWLNKLFSKKTGEPVDTADVDPEQRDLLVEVGIINREGKPNFKKERNEFLKLKTGIEQKIAAFKKQLLTLTEQKDQALTKGDNGTVFRIDGEIRALNERIDSANELLASVKNQLNELAARAQQEKQEDRKLAADRVKDLLSEEDNQLTTSQLNKLYEELQKPDLDKDQRLHHLVVLYLYSRIGLILGPINLKQSYGLLNEKGITISALNQVKKELHLEPVLTEKDKKDKAYQMGLRLGSLIGRTTEQAGKKKETLLGNLNALFRRGPKSTEVSEAELTPAQKELEEAADQAKVKLQAKGIWGLLINAPAMIEGLESSVEKLAAVAIMFKDAQKQYTDEQQVELADAGFSDEVLAVLRKRYEAEDKARLGLNQAQEIGLRLLGSLEAMNEKSKREKAKRAEEREAEKQSKADYKKVGEKLKEARNKLKDLERKIADSKNLLINLTGYDFIKEKANLEQLESAKLDLQTEINGLETTFAQLKKEKKERDLSLRKDLVLAIIGASMIEIGILLGSGQAQENLRWVLESLRALFEKNPNADVSQFRAMGDNISRLNPNAGKLFHNITESIFSGARQLGQVAEQAQAQADKVDAAKEFSRTLSETVRDMAGAAQKLAEQASGVKEALASVKLPELNFVDQFKNILTNVNVPAGGNVWDKVVPEIRNIFGVSENMWRTASADQAQFIMDALKDLFPELNNVSPGVHDFSNLLGNENVRQAFQRLFESKNAQEAQSIVDQLKNLRAAGVF